MKTSSGFPEQFSLLTNTLYFLKKHLLIITGLGLVAAFGRVIQLGGFGTISAWTNIILEVVVESSRVLLLLYVLGLANVRKGFLRILQLFTSKTKRNTTFKAAYEKLKAHWLSIILNCLAFLCIAWSLNYLIDLVAYETCFYLSLKREGILMESSSEWTILLFFKNLTVIPFTLVFDAMLLLWLCNKITGLTKLRIANN